MASGGGRDKGRRVHSACAPVSLVQCRAFVSVCLSGARGRAVRALPRRRVPPHSARVNSRRWAVGPLRAARAPAHRTHRLPLFGPRSATEADSCESAVCGFACTAARVRATAPRGETAQVQHVSAAKPRPQPPWRCGGASHPAVQNAPLEDARRTRSRAPRGAGAPMRDRGGGQHGLRDEGAAAPVEQ
ncbi:hypothetical protein ERJ75_001544800 [Trypanosoma vivax]|nr:hypothetical protein ERJ75_001544800 [Trypanosoma vivax]